MNGKWQEWQVVVVDQIFTPVDPLVDQILTPLKSTPPHPAPPRPPSLNPLASQADLPGVRWENFALTDNSCKAAESKVEEFEADLQLVETKVRPVPRIMCAARDEWCAATS